MADTSYPSHDDHPESYRNSLPSLQEVLSRNTKAPVDLFSFYIYMRDQQRSVDYLEFWLDVSQHMALCRHYVRELRRSVLLETPELEKALGGNNNNNNNNATSKRSSQALENFYLTEPGPAGSIHSTTQDQRLSAFLRESNHNNRDSSSQRPSHWDSDSLASRTGLHQHSDSMPRPSLPGSNYTDARDSQSPAKDSTPQHTASRADIRASAEKILYTFLLPGAEREITLPSHIVNDITVAIEEQGRDDPEVFDAAKEYVFLAIERDAFPGFLRAKALGNLVPPHLMLRLIVGLLSLFAAFWAAFCLIFLNETRRTRCWLILPFLVGIYALVSHQYTLDPILAFVGYSESTFLSWIRVQEPFVRRLLVKRATTVSLWIVVVTTALVCLFVFVPGKRL